MANAELHALNEQLRQANERAQDHIRRLEAQTTQQAEHIRGLEAQLAELRQMVQTLTNLRQPAQP